MPQSWLNKVSKLREEEEELLRKKLLKEKKVEMLRERELLKEWLHIKEEKGICIERPSRTERGGRNDDDRTWP